MTAKAPPRRGLTVCEAAELLRVSADKVRSWIRRGELVALDTGDRRGGRRRFVILPGAIEKFAAARSPAEPPAVPRRRRKATSEVDFFPGD